ncbi:hypothetical protein P886_0987 [Alteromonadaceae bacterium 2753L.S.0a.02]|nr:hypothetical protein P886_0987 [Alteromonadaceae bacterium 2753L.S.0a.02]
MAPCKLNNYGWIVLDVDEAHEQQARDFRAKRDRLYGNIYSERETDEIRNTNSPKQTSCNR